MRSGELDNALIVAAKALDVEAVRHLLQLGADPNAREPSEEDPDYPLPDWSVLDLVISNQEMSLSEDGSRLRLLAEQIVEILLEAGARPEGTAFAEVLIVLVAKKGFCRILQMLVRFGSNPNVASSSGETALHCAILTCDLETIKCLVDHGADVNVLGMFRRSPRYIALVEGKKDVASYLRSVGGLLKPDPSGPVPFPEWAGVRGVYLDLDEFDQQELQDNE